MGAEKIPNVIRELRGIRWWLGATADREQVAPLLAAAVDAIESGAMNLKSGRRKELYRLTLLGDEPDHLLKVTRYLNGSSWTRRVRKSKARREIEMAAQLHDHEINTPLPVAAGERRRGGFLTACYLLIPLERDAIDLAILANSSARPRDRQAITTRFGALAARLHAIGFRQADFAPNNFLVRLADPPEIVPIDFERASLHTGKAGLDRHERVQSLAKLERHCVDSSSTDRLRFLIAYAGDRKAARSYWHDIPHAIATLFARDEKRLRPISASGARRHERFRAGDWHGWAVRQGSGNDRVRAWLARDSRAGRIDTQAAFWACSYHARTEPQAADLWATSLALWVRGLAPQPICAVQRGREVRLFLNRNVPSPADKTVGQLQVAAERKGIPATRSLMWLIDRLLGLGEISSQIAAGSVAIVRGSDGSSRATLIDIALFRSGAPNLSQRRALAREISNRLVAESLAQETRD